MFTLDCGDMELTASEAKATYVQIRKYVSEKFGAKVSSLYIAQVKRKYGLDLGKNLRLSGCQCQQSYPPVQIPCHTDYPKILANFDKLYYRLTDLEKKEFLRDFIESVEIYPEKMDNGRMLKQINFNFPVYYDGEVSREINLPEIRLLNENTVENVVLMSRVEK